MKLAAFDVYRYSLPFKRPVTLWGRQPIGLRTGLVFALHFEGSWTGWGEIAPLAGIRRTSLKKCLQDLKTLLGEMKQRPLPDVFERWEEEFFSWLDSCELTAEVRCGVEMALYQVAARRFNRPIRCLLAQNPAESVLGSGLLLEKTRLESHIDTMLAQGYRSIKVKMGANTEEDIRRIKAVLLRIGGRARIHLDANRNWSFNEALRIAASVDREKIEYVEEPFLNLTQIPEFFKKTSLPVALDESLLLSGYKAVRGIPGVKFWVLKCMLLGGPRETLRAACQARADAIQPVIGSSFESGLGLSFLVHVAAATGDKARAGLDTLKYFRKDLLKCLPFAGSGNIRFPQRTLNETELRLEFLTRV